MREILFRGKRMGSGEWVIGMPLNQNWSGDKTYFWLPDMADLQGLALGYFAGSRFAEVLTETVGQYTGLEDKTGKRIFEGDIVHYVYEPGEGYWNSNQNSVIKWKSTGFYMCGIMGTNKYACANGWLESIPHGDGACFEVIGNIYDHPELLDGVTHE